MNQERADLTDNLTDKIREAISEHPELANADVIASLECVKQEVVDMTLGDLGRNPLRQKIEEEFLV